MFYTGIDPFTGEEVYTARNLNDRKMQRALLQFFKPENYFEVRKALLEAGRADLIGSGCDALIPSQPPKVALQARMSRANGAIAEGEYVHAIPKNGRAPAKRDIPDSTPVPNTPRPENGMGYRPKRKTARRRSRG